MQVMQRTRLTVTVLSALAATFGLAAMPARASAAAVHPSAVGATTPAAAGPQIGDTRQVCPVVTQPGYVTCQAIVKLTSAAKNAPAVTGPAAAIAYGPGSLRSAYGLAKAAASRGKGRTVAIVDAYNDPHAAGDLAKYRAHYHLGGCTKASGCLHILNQNGKSAHLPKANVGWAQEESLDLDMVSAICPKCHITLVEANAATTRSLGIAENTAASRSSFISNSWSGAEFKTEGHFNHYFNHPRHAVVFASGDNGHADASYPGVLRTVISVGGTRLVHKKSGSRAWTETVWGNRSGQEGTQSGCSKFAAKPSWQRHSRFTCPHRTQNDVSADADPNTGVAVYDSYHKRGWMIFGGTSAATPMITAAYALAGRPSARYPASKIYAHPGKFHDVRSGQNGTCSRAYVCHARTGYDGPTGVGTPSGLGGL